MKKKKDPQLQEMGKNLAFLLPLGVMFLFGINIGKNDALKTEAKNQYKDILHDMKNNQVMMKKQDFDSIKKLEHFKEIFEEAAKYPVINPTTKDTLGFKFFH